MSGLSKMIADFFVRENVIEHEEYEIYKYGSDILIENIGTTIFLICLGFIFNADAAFAASAYWRGKERWEEKIVQLLC